MSHEISSWAGIRGAGRSPGISAPVLVALIILTVEVGVLGGLYASGRWIADPAGKPIMIDFLGFWVVGRFVLEGNALAIYDWRTLYDAQVAILGADVGRFSAFAYPPVSLLWLAPLSALPYPVAFFTFITLTGGAFAYIVGAIAARPSAAILALAVPPALSCVVPGQNGFLTATLIGALLLLLERRPLLSGVCLGVLTYKPHFGPLFPLVLILDRRWVSFVAASATALAVFCACWLAFGWDIFPAFLRGWAIAGDALLIEGAVSPSKMQSIYGLARSLGAANELAWTLHAPVALVAALAPAWLWRQTVSYPLKAAAVATATLLITPFVLTYDYLILTIATAFLWRAREFDRNEWAVVLCANLVLAMAIVAPIPLGPIAPILMAALVVRRLAHERNVA